MASKPSFSFLNWSLIFPGYCSDEIIFSSLPWPKHMCIMLDVGVLHSVTTLTEYIMQGTELL